MTADVVITLVLALFALAVGISGAAIVLRERARERDNF
jgi:hypothetical protein